jgi:signal transduction histidine kinase
LIRTSEPRERRTGPGGAVAGLLRVAGLFACIFASENALGLIENYQPTGWDFAFYTMAISTIAFTALIVLAYRQQRWLIYSIFSLTLLIDAAAMDGVLRYMVQGDDFVLWVVPFLAHATAAIAGWVLVGLRTEPAYWNGIVRPVAFTLALITSIFPLTSYFWLEKISIVLMWIPVNASFFLMMTAQILPPLSWDSEQKWQLKATRLFAVSIALFLVTPYVLGGFLPLDLSQQQINAFFRAALLAFTLFSLMVVVGQATASIRARERAEREAADAARNEALLQLELERSEREYQQALSSAVESRSQLASVSHDLRQPIATLRMTIAQLQKDAHRTGKDDTAERLAQAVDYVDHLASLYTGHDDIDLRAWEHDDSESGTDHSKPENVRAEVLTATIRQMFDAEAASRNMTLRTYGDGLALSVAPLPMLRIISNLVSNALQHSGASRLVLAFRPHGDRVRFQLTDNGIGMDEAKLEEVREWGVKGEFSLGDGLGLSIVQALCREQGFKWNIASRLDCGTTITMDMPLTPLQ